MILKSIFWNTGSQCSDLNNTLNQNWDKHAEYIWSVLGSNVATIMR